MPSEDAATPEETPGAVSMEFSEGVMIFLTEDGGLECMYFDPYVDEEDRVYHSLGRLPWLSNIVSLSFEPHDEGTGEMTVFAEDRFGLRYDVSIPLNLMNIFDAEWYCELSGDVYCTLQFYENGGVTYNFGSEDTGELYEMYRGTFEIALAEDDGLRPGIMSFDMTLDWWIYEGFDGVSDEEAAYWVERQEIIGSYFTQSDGFLLSLWLSDGKALVHNANGSPVEYYEFWQPSLHMGL